MNTHQLNADVKNGGAICTLSHIAIQPYIFMGWLLIKHRTSFIIFLTTYFNMQEIYIVPSRCIHMIVTIKFYCFPKQY
jgi:hypothetical protein